VSVAYYANATAKDTPWVILGGNFSLPDVQANNLGIWDAAGGTILPVVSSSINPAESARPADKQPPLIGLVDDIERDDGSNDVCC
jgi:hypothetical protein